MDEISAGAWEQKTVQLVRLVDVFLLGPFLIYSAKQFRGPEWARAALVISGLLTIYFNGLNFLEIRAEEKP